MYAEEIVPAVARMVDAMEKWSGSGEPNHVGYSLAQDTDKHCFDYMAQFPGRVKRFNDAMTLFSHGPGYGPDALIDYFSTNCLTRGTFVDVGGSHGAFSIPIVRKFPALRAIVQDRVHVTETGQKQVPGDVMNRLKFMPHDFFQGQTVIADVYLLRWILHDWSDTYCLKILRALIPALRPGARVLIHEWIAPEPHQAPPHEQSSVRYVKHPYRCLVMLIAVLVFLICI